MDFLNQALTQLKNRFRSTPPGTRVAAGLLLLAMAVGVGYLFTFQRSGDEVYLFEGAKMLPEDLPKMRTAFAQKQLNSYTIDGNRIRIPRKQLSEYVSALDEAKAWPPRFSEAFDDAIGPPSIWQSRDMTELRQRIAKQKELVRILCTWNFIADARVIIDTQSQGGFRRERIVTASVSVTPAGSVRLNANQVSDIRRFITGAVAGLKADNVIISDSSGSVDRNDRVALTKAYECEWTAKIRDALSYIPGVVVTTNVVLDRQNQSNASQIDSPSIAEEYATGNANVPLSIRRWPRGRLSPETTQTDMACTPTRISVSVAVPDSYFAKVWRKRNPSANVTLEKVRTEETAKIRSQVANLLPAEGLSDPAGLVSISTLHDLASEGAAGASGYKAIVAWAGEHQAILGFAGVAMLGLLISWSVIQVKRAARKADNGPTILPMETDKDEETAAADRRELSLHDELRQFVRDNPAAAADTLNAWIRNAG